MVSCINISDKAWIYQINFHVFIFESKFNDTYIYLAKYTYLVYVLKCSLNFKVCKNINSKVIFEKFIKLQFKKQKRMLKNNYK